MTVGIDEVGRGCWAGPLVAAAVVLGKHRISGLTDSKMLTTKKRELLSDQILAQAEAVGIGWVEPEFIDKQGLTMAVKLAMTQALQAITVNYSKIIIDGNINYLSDNPKAECLVRADATMDEVSAASIVAKVARDTYMRNIAMAYPEYGFDKHVGYGTLEHIKQLKSHGVCAIHRLSYKPIKQILAVRSD